MFTQGRSVDEIIHSDFFSWLIMIELMIGMLIYLIIVSVRFVRSFDDYHREAEEQKQALNHYKYATLKNQVNPHFLFNSLNVLSGLMYKNVEKADDFITRLSGIYRYVLDVQDEEVVSVERELAFARDYLYLQSIRFGDGLRYEINVQTNKYIIPMALQILIENALKHNEISNENSLAIEIISDKQYLIVRNNINPKKDSAESHELGLENIKGRYAFLTDTPLKVEKNNHRFEVYLPLLNLKD